MAGGGDKTKWERLPSGLRELYMEDKEDEFQEPGVGDVLKKQRFLDTTREIDARVNSESMTAYTRPAQAQGRQNPSLKQGRWA